MEEIFFQKSLSYRQYESGYPKKEEMVQGTHPEEALSFGMIQLREQTAYPVENLKNYDC